MSELIQKHDNRATIRWKLLTGASAMALTAYVASTALARADDSDRPTLWIELGGQMELMDGLTGTPFTAPFMLIDPGQPAVYHGSTFLRNIDAPDVYKGFSISDSQRAPRFAFGEEGKISFQPKDSDWIFSAGIRYGRSHNRRHFNQQTPSNLAQPYYTRYHNNYALTYNGQNTFLAGAYYAEFLRAETQRSERHMVLDFSAGKDVGLGLLGRDGKSTLSAGVRLVDLSESMSAAVYARPNISFIYPPPKYTVPKVVFHAYTMTAQAARSFRGVGPSLSWNASAALAGNKQDGELALDWSINAAVLFGRQKAKTRHTTQAHHEYLEYHTYYGYVANVYDRYGQLYGPNVHDNPLRSRKVTVPNIGATVGLSVKYPNFKFSVGYRYDTFLKAMDTGIDARETSNLTFQGPYASISIGLGD